MRAIVQRVSSASIACEGSVIAAIGDGLLVYLGVETDDSETDLNYIVEKITTLRIFEDDVGKMNRNVTEITGEVLVVSAFTLLADARKGRRPSFTRSADPQLAENLYNALIDRLKARQLTIQSGRFRQFMAVTSTNAGPVCILLDSRRIF